MSLFEDLPFPIGTTYFQGGITPVIGTADSTYEGREYWVPDTNPFTGLVRSNRLRKVRIYRCMSANGVLLPGLLAQHSTVLSSTNPLATEYGTRALALLTGTAQYAIVIDEYLPAAGINQYDLFYAVVRGPAGILTAATTAANSIAWGNLVQGISGGFIDLQSTFATNAVGKALTSITSGAAQATLLVDVGAAYGDG